MKSGEKLVHIYSQNTHAAYIQTQEQQKHELGLEEKRILDLLPADKRGSSSWRENLLASQHGVTVRVLISP